MACCRTGRCRDKLYLSLEDFREPPSKKMVRKEAGLTPGLWNTLRADVFRYRGSTAWSAFLDAWLHEPGFRFTWYLRKVSFYGKRKRSLYLLPYLYNRILLNHYRFRYGFDISPTTTIGPGLYLGHFGGIVISPFAVLGSNVNVAKGATIGRPAAALVWARQCSKTASGSESMLPWWAR